MSDQGSPRPGGLGRRRHVDGVLLLDKPGGITSNATVQRVRRLMGAAKAGHTGTLDPMATGLLPVCFGEATKFSHLLLDADKLYLATIRLGVMTTTGDIEGKVTARGPVNVGRTRIEEVIKEFTGDIVQIPPMYSALKRGGQPLYKLARAGAQVPRTPRNVTIHDLTLVDRKDADLVLAVHCSKGTYVRVLAEDMGRALGCGACLVGLRRQKVGSLKLNAGAVTLSLLESLTFAQRDNLLLPPDAMVASLPRLDLEEAQATRICRGLGVECRGTETEGLARIYGPECRFLGIAQVTAPGHIRPRRLIASV